MNRDEQRALKEWLTSIKPDGLSRNDIADELGVTRRTISSMLNPEVAAFPGLTMLRYLRLAGAVTDAPAESPIGSHLARLEARLDESIALTEEALELLREVRRQAPEAGQEGREASWTAARHSPRADSND